ncbi:MAG: hypothetical protein EOM53_04270 [Alphaproteobacteria bacterium]|nr:hypothetical protein [Alphaproteobacteria bacterium]
MGNYFENKDILKQFLDNKKIDLSLILKTINQNQYLKKYFYEHISDVKLFDVLNAKKLFDTPPIFMKKRDDKTVLYEPWYEGIYLNKLVGKKDADLIKLIQKWIQDLKKGLNNKESTVNFLFIDYMIGALNLLFDTNKDIVFELLKDILKYQKFYDNSLWYRKQDFIPKLLNDSNENEALLVAVKLFKLYQEKDSFSSIKSYLDEYLYEQFLSKIESEKLEFKWNLSKCIINNFAQSLSDEDIKKLDISFLSRRSMEKDNEQNKYLSNKEFNLILDMYIDSSLKLLKRKEKTIQDVMGLNGKLSSLSKRVDLFLLQQSDNAELIAENLISKENLNNSLFYNEYYNLLQKKFDILSDGQKEKLFDYILTYQKDTTDAKTKDWWILRWLHCIKENSKNFPPYYATKYDEVYRPEIETFKNPDFLIHTEWSDEYFAKSAFEKKDLENLSFKEILSKITHFEYTNEYKAPTMEGTANVLVEIILERKEDFFNSIDGFKTLKPVYINKIIDGFCNEKAATLTDDEINKLLEFAKNFLNKENAKDYSPSFSDDENWNWVFFSINRFINFIDKEKHISLVKEILTALMEKEFSFKDDVDKTAPNFDPYLSAINSISGQAFNTYLTLFIDSYSKNFSRDKDVTLQKLQNIIEQDNDKSLMLRTIIGIMLPWIIKYNLKWFRKNKEKLLPKGDSPSDRLKFYSVFASYLNYRPYFHSVYLETKDNFKYVALDSSDKDLCNLNFEKFTQIVFYSYLNGNIPLKPSFFNNDLTVQDLLENNKFDTAIHSVLRHLFHSEKLDTAKKKNAMKLVEFVIEKKLTSLKKERYEFDFIYWILKNEQFMEKDWDLNIFIQLLKSGLPSSTYQDITTRLLTKLENKNGIDKVVEVLDCYFKEGMNEEILSFRPENFEKLFDKITKEPDDLSDKNKQILKEVFNRIASIGKDDFVEKYYNKINRKN